MNPAILLKHYDELKGNLAISFNSTTARLIVLGLFFCARFPSEDHLKNEPYYPP